MADTPLAVGVAGAAGKMGRAVRKAVDLEPRTMLAAAIEKPGNSLVGSTVSGNIACATAQTQDWSKISVLIDFSAPEGVAEHSQQAARSGCALVVGTTGLDANQKTLLDEAARSVPTLVAPNMSLGVNALFEIVDRAASILPDWDAELLDIHHRDKIDAPSGTAVRLVEILQSSGRSNTCADRTRRRQSRPDGEVGVSVMRAGNIVGEHTVLLAGHGERLEITHRATSRTNFAHGAVCAALYIAGRKAGKYTMREVLGLA